MPSLTKKLRNLGPPPSQRRARQSTAPSAGFGFPLRAVDALDVARIRAIWKDWYESGLMPRPWDTAVYLAILPSLIEADLVDWTGMEDVRPKVLGVLERLETGAIRPEEFEAQMASRPRSSDPGPPDRIAQAADQQGG